MSVYPVISLWFSAENDKDQIKPDASLFKSLVPVPGPRDEFWDEPGFGICDSVPCVPGLTLISRLVPYRVPRDFRPHSFGPSKNGPIPLRPVKRPTLMKMVSIFC